MRWVMYVQPGMEGCKCWVLMRFWFHVLPFGKCDEMIRSLPEGRKFLLGRGDGLLYVKSCFMGWLHRLMLM